jgi:hypothetical protein
VYTVIDCRCPLRDPPTRNDTFHVTRFAVSRRSIVATGVTLRLVTPHVTKRGHR